MKTAIAILWLFGAASIGMALAWECYQFLILAVGNWRALTLLTFAVIVLVIVWVVAITDFPIDPSSSLKDDYLWR